MTHVPATCPTSTATEPSAETAAALTAAFEAFNAVSRELEGSYRALEREVGQLRRELHRADARQAEQAQRLTALLETRHIDELVSRHRRLAATGEMAATLTHQIRTPLAAALLYATNASRPELPAEQRDGLLGKAIACLQDLEQLVGDMLRFARGSTLNGSSFTLRELLASVENSLRPIVLASQQLCIEGPDRDVPLTGNRETLASALINLATNALNAGGPAAHVHVVARDAGLQAEIIVVDDGPGVVAELRERIFEPFFTSRSDGTGLGLSVARSIARAHRGDVALVDGSAGSTTFALRLPIAATEVTAQQPRTAAA